MAKAFDPSKLNYGWRSGKGYKCDPNVAAGELAKIQKKRGLITPDSIVERAIKKNNPLHGDFTWENNAAACKWRRQEARNLIGSLVIVRVVESDSGQQEERVIKAFVSMDVEEPERAYVDINTVLRDEALSHQILEYALKKAQYWLSEYRNYKHFSDMQRPYDHVSKAVSYLQKAVAKGG